MNVEYKRDFNKNYLIITDSSDGFQTEMIIRNKSEEFITVKKEDWDGETKLFYDITGKQTLEKGFLKRNITFKDLSDILFSIENVVKECKRLFLDVSGILFSPEFIYRDLSNDRIYWIYNPNSEKCEGLLDLAEYILEHIDNDNQYCVKAGYEFYRRAKEGSIEAESLFELLQTKEIKEESEQNNEIEIDNCLEKELLNLKESRVKKGKIEYTIDKLFNLMKKKKPEDEVIENYVSNEERFEEDEPEEEEYAAQTVFLNLGDGDFKKLISRDSTIPDAFLETFPCVLGSKRDCVDILLNDKSISRMHAQIDQAEGKLYLYDLNSKNGTFLNGHRVIEEELELKDGDEIRLGNLRFILA